MDGPWKRLIILSSCVYAAGAILSERTNPHAPQQLTWQIISLGTDTLINSTQQIAPLGTWWPNLHFCLRQVIPAARRVPPNLVRSYGFYSCPDADRGSHCGGPQDYFCRSWGCVTSNDGDWQWATSSARDRLSFSFVNAGPGKYAQMELYKNKPCSPADLHYIRAEFTEKGKTTEFTRWHNGLTWGLVFYNHGGGAGSNFLVCLKVESPSPQPIGPNRVLPEQRLPAPVPAPALAPAAPPKPSTRAPPKSPPPSTSPPSSNTGQRLFNLIQGAFTVLNGSDPNRILLALPSSRASLL